MPNAPKFSIVMNCRNSAKYLREAIDSVYAQRETDWEIIFFDNASTDESAPIASSYDNRLRYFRSDHSVPLGEARNLALKEARGNYVAFLDCDDVWYPHRLAAHASVLDRDKTVGLVFSNYHDWFEDQGRLSLAVAESEPRSGRLFGQQLARYRIGILAASFRRSLLAELPGWFDPSLNLIEDMDFFLRLLYQTDGHYLPDPIGKYRVHGSNLSATLRQQWPTEMQRVYENFRTSCPGFETAFTDEARQLRQHIAFLQARTRMENGDLTGARNALASYRFASPRLFALALLTWFPPALWNALYRTYRSWKYA